ncbi:MAG: tRNA 5-methoxyuridine(34)/uridine 5-oxyacetic acid(34) synthase CmoB [Bacteriovoracaceae bacterium]|nr:tRNA 5-methoxyuridine(34)/uridine 5-oxyacetic acid(34) synthase CmoB [Bacteriovoracaceae bacterium]
MKRDLSYLSPFKKNLQWSQLCELKDEREAWWERESSKKWLIEKYPSLEISERDFSSSWITIKGENPPEKVAQLEELAKGLTPWKKGPFNLFDIEIDAEWRSDHKWERLLPALDSLKDKVVCDVGCNNGYFMFRMAHHEPRLVLGIDPVLHMQAQFDLVQNYATAPGLQFELFGVEHLPLFKDVFDAIFHMGIIYHHRHPIQQLTDIRESLKPGGVVYLETIGIPGEDSVALFPEDRYGRMGNCWFVPTMSCFINWAKRAKLIDVEVIANTPLTEDEQRLTPWCPPPFQSLKASLDEENPELTIEGYPAPRRFLIKAYKKKS